MPKIDVPALVTSGRHDEATPAIAQTVHRGLRGSESILFADSAHMAHLEEPERYAAVLQTFLSRHDSTPARSGAATTAAHSPQ